MRKARSGLLNPSQSLLDDHSSSPSSEIYPKGLSQNRGAAQIWMLSFWFPFKPQAKRRATHKTRRKAAMLRGVFALGASEAAPKKSRQQVQAKLERAKDLQQREEQATPKTRSTRRPEPTDFEDRGEEQVWGGRSRSSNVLLGP